MGSAYTLCVPYMLQPLQAQFGTLSDYFNAVRKESKQEDLTQAALQSFPSLSGKWVRILPFRCKNFFSLAV